MMITGVFILTSFTMDAGMMSSSEDIQARLKEEIFFYLEDAINIEPGKNNTINLLLPNADAVGISFNIQVNTWESTAQDVILN